MLGRLLALRQQQGPYQPGADLDQTPAAPQTSVPAPLPWLNLLGTGLTASAARPPLPDLHSQYQALRPVLGDRNAMLATVSPEAGQTLIAQALASRQNPANAGDAASRGDGQPIASDASSSPVRPGSQYAQAAIGLCATGPAGCAAGLGLTAGQAILGGLGALGGLGGLILNNQKEISPQVPLLPEKLIGNNARPGRNRDKTDMPGVDPTPDELFDRLTGGQSVILPDGTRRGSNGIRLRPDSGSGPRIDIPANGEKKHETIHFPGSNQ
ncbi:MAG: hypothetical protein ACRD5Z_26305 [Bryobacteraceae bacterium]